MKPVFHLPYQNCQDIHTLFDMVIDASKIFTKYKHHLKKCIKKKKPNIHLNNNSRVRFDHNVDLKKPYLKI